MEFLIIGDIFSIFLLEPEIDCQDRFQKTKSTNQLDFLLIEYYIFEKKYTQFENCHSVKRLIQKNGKTKNLGGHFWKISDSLLNRIYNPPEIKINKLKQ